MCGTVTATCSAVHILCNVHHLLFAALFTGLFPAHRRVARFVVNHHEHTLRAFDLSPYFDALLACCSMPSVTYAAAKKTCASCACRLRPACVHWRATCYRNDVAPLPHRSFAQKTGWVGRLVSVIIVRNCRDEVRPNFCATSRTERLA